MAQDICPVGVKNDERILTLEREMGEVRNDIKDIKDTLLKRPSWSVTIIITLLSTASVSAITFAITTLKLIK